VELYEMMFKLMGNFYQFTPLCYTRTVAPVIGKKQKRRWEGSYKTSVSFVLY